MSEQKKSNHFFNLNNRVIGWAVFSCIILWIMYIILLILGKINYHIVIDVFQNIFLVSATILTSTLITTTLIEAKSKNDICEDIVTNGFLQSKSFIALLPKTRQTQVYHALHESLYGENQPPLDDMLECTKRKIKKQEEIGYYFSQCEALITCTIDEENKCILKTIKRVYHVKSYKPENRIQNFRLLTSTSATQNSVRKFQCHIESTELYDSQLNISKMATDETIALKCGYKWKTEYRLEEPLVLNAEKPTIITIDYETEVPIHDVLFIVRMYAACKESNFRLRIVGQNKERYKAVAAGFGTIGSSSGSINDDSDDEVYLNFRDWLFEDDGVAFAIEKVK